MGRTGGWYPLSQGQEALWFLNKLVPETWAYNIVFPVGIRGPLDVDAFRLALQKVLDRHPCLRTAFKVEGGAPYQRALNEHTVRLDQIDASTWTGQELEAALRERAHRPFDLEMSAEPTIALFRRAPDRHVFLFVVHHIVCDLWSLIIVIDELRLVYQSQRDGVECSLPPAGTPYEEYVAQESRRLEGESGERLSRYWDAQLDWEHAPIDLPTDHARPPAQSFRGGTLVRRMDAGLTRELKTLAARERVTLYMLLLAAYQVLLHRYTGQTRFFVGSPTSGRDQRGLQNLVGDLVNMVPLRADLTENPSFLELLQHTRRRVVEAIEHQGYPFSRLVDRSHTARDLSRSPIFQTTFALQRFQRYPALARVLLPADDEPRIPFADLELEPIPMAQQDGQFDLNVEMKEADNGELVGAWKYAADLFEAGTIAGMAGHFQTLLEEIVAHPERPIGELRLLSAAERQAMIARAHAASSPLPGETTVAELFRAQAARRGAAVALRCGDDSLTYRELEHRATSLARHLVHLGVGRDALVAVLLPRGLEFITGLLGISLAGGAFLPMDVRHPIARTLQILHDSATRVVLVSGQTPSSVVQAIAAMPEASRPTVVDLDVPLPMLELEPLPSVRGSDLGYVMYTSGSTGVPKGVMVEHSGMVNHVLAKCADLDITEDTTLAQNGPPTFDIVVWQCLAPLIVGGTVTVFPDEVAENPARFMAEVNRCGVTVLQMVPSMLHAVLEEVASRRGPAPTLASLKWMVPTGEALPTTLTRRWLELYPEIPVLNTYGSTECSDDQCHFTVRRLEPADEAVAVVSIGTPIRNMAAHVLDGNLEPVPDGVVGELYIGGLGVGRGYLKDPERTAAAFLRAPFSGEPGARLYRTRDLARRRSDGNLDFLGRIDNMIKLRGFRIDPGDIVAALTSHPSVSDACVVLRTPPSGERLLVGYVVRSREEGRPAAGPGSDELRRFLLERLPQPMVPTVYCYLEQLPLTANGKLDARRLPEPEWGLALEQQLVPPRTATERTLAALWCDVLGLERVGVTHDFFSIGGDSIRSIRIVARCLQSGLPIQPGDLFLHPTIEALAALADGRSASGGDGRPELEPRAPSLAIDPEELERAVRQVAFRGDDERVRSGDTRVGSRDTREEP